ncbi:PREDICTED: ABC transporter G family member 11-like [Fragaria vesca subsp. vesca]
MEHSSSPASFPRWAPSPSPSRGLLLSPPVEDAKIKSSSAAVHDSAEDAVSLSCSSMERIFPFGIGFKSTTAAVTAYGSAVETSLEAENAHAPRKDGASATHVVELGPRENGASLTWDDLWVGVSDGKGGQKMILQGLTGFAQPGEVLAIMGPSGCGKSTLLDALGGRLSSSTQQKGKILINGHKETLAFGTSAYVTQDDTLMTTLTVTEVVYYSAQLQLPNSMSKTEKKVRAETTIKEMGLQDSMDTRIGGWGKKSLSGGQKRRVSICIEILTRPKLLFLDEPTSGLDSAASYHVMSRIIKLAHHDGMTIVASIHQPSSEVFELFQNLCLLSSGRIVYFGPASQAEEFFASNGFPCPTLRNPSDHYLRTINKDFDTDIEQGLGGKTRTEEAIDILINSYKSSSTFKQLHDQVAKICQQKRGALEKGSQANFMTQCLVLTRRSFVNMYRDLGYYWLRLFIYISLCLCVGTIYHEIDTSYDSIQDRATSLMFVAAFLTFMAIGGFPSYVEDMKIFRRERLNGHYGVAAFVVGNSFSSIPYLLMNSVIPGAIVFFLVGLQQTFDHFAYFALVLFVTLLLVESLMMIVASIVPDFLMGVITGSGILGKMLLAGGLFRKPHDLPNFFWRYPMYYIGFHKYVSQGFYKNEFEGLTFPNNQAGGSLIITGEEILKNIWEMEMSYSKWVDLAILFGMVILYRLLFFGIIKASEKVTPIIKAFMVRVTVKDNSSA